MGHRAAGVVLAVPDRRLHRRRTRRRVSRSRSRGLLSTSPRARSTARCGHRTRSGAGEAQYGPGNYIPQVRLDLLEHARDGLPRQAVFMVAALGALGCSGEGQLEQAKWFQRAAVVTHRVAVPRCTRRLDPDRDRPPAVDRAGAAEDRRRGLADGRHDDDRRPASACSWPLRRARVVDFVLMRRYARPRPARVGGDAETRPLPAASY